MSSISITENKIEVNMWQRLSNQKEKEAREKDNPTLSKVIERNIRTIIHFRKLNSEKGNHGE